MSKIKVYAMNSYKQMWETIAMDIQEDIQNGKLGPQERLKEAELAAKYSVSKTPVREALRYLESIGFVEIVPHTMAYVKPIDKKEIENLYTIQSVLEGLAVRQAIRNLTKQDHRLMEQSITLMEKYHREKNFPEYEKANIAFQSIIWKASGNEDLVGMLHNIFLRVQRFRSVTRRYPDGARDVTGPHREILETLIQGDRIKAEKLVRKHLEKFGREIVAKMEKEKNSRRSIQEGKES